MNKTITVNIGGLVFNIEELAYDKLRNYLAAISSWFKGQEGEEEIIADIEQRVAELFTERLVNGRQVVTEEDVDFVIATMGQPEQYETHDEESGSTENASSTQKGKNTHRRIYRDPEDAVIGGVASGISHSLGWDPLALRIVYVLLAFFGFAGIPIYIILWIVIPEARTTSERLRMKGERINVENISKAVNKGVDNVTDSVKNADVSSGIDKILSGLGAVLGFIAKGLRYIFGVLFLLIGVSMLVGFIVALAGYSIGNAAIPIDSELLRDYIFYDANMYVVSIIAAILLIATPVIGFIYTGIRLLLQYTPPIKGIGLSLIVLFIIGSILASVAITNQVSQYAHRESVEQTVEIPVNDTLVIQTASDPYWHDQLRITSLDELERMKYDGDDLVFCDPRFRIKSTTKDGFRMELERESSANNSTNAIENAEEIEFQYELQGDTLILDPYFKVPREQRYRDQELKITIYVPEGGTVMPDESTSRLVRGYFSGIEDVSGYDIPGEVFRNDSTNLICLTCE